MNDNFKMGKFDFGSVARAAIAKGAANSIHYIQQVANDEISAEEAVDKIVEATLSAAAETVATGFSNMEESDLIVEIGAKNTASQILTGQGLKNTLTSNAITGGAALAIEAAKDLVKLGQGEITPEECFERQGKNLLNTAEGIVGASLGSAGGVAIASSLGMGAGSTGAAMATLAGGLSGGMIAGLALTLAIENGVEKPYRDLLRSTENLREAAVELERLSRTMFKGQVLFSKYVQADMMLEKEFQTQMKRVDEAGKRAMEVINKI